MRRAMPRKVLLCVLAVAALGVLLISAATASAGVQAKSDGDTLIVLVPHLAPGLDGDGVGANDPGLWQIYRNVYGHLVVYPTTKQGAVLVPNYNVRPSQFVPQLAESYSQKGLTWTFKLRKGIKSCAGNELSADDVVYTIARAKSVSGTTPLAWFLFNLMGVLPLDPLVSKDPKAKELKGEVTKIDNSTVQVKQLNKTELFPRLFEIFGLNIYDSKEMKKHATAKDPWSHSFATSQGAAGYGPYCITRWSKGSEIELAANPSWPQQPHFTKAIVRQVPVEANRVAALRAGAADIVTDLSPNSYDSLKSVSSVDVLSKFNNQATWMTMNYKFAPWNLPKNKLLRQAVAYAMPYDEIIKSDYRGEAKRWYGMVPSAYYGYVPYKLYNTNIAKAKALLAQAGFPGGKGLDKYASGLTLIYPAERAAVLEPVANRIRTALAAIGVPITLNPLSQTEVSDRENTKKDMPMSLIDYSAPFGPDTGYGEQLYYVSVAKGGLNNGQNYSNATFDTLFAKGQLLTGAARKASLAKTQRILMEDLPIVPLAEFQSKIAVRKGLSGWLITTDNQPGLWSFTKAGK